jgi:hypothetical protein
MATIWSGKSIAIANQLQCKFLFVIGMQDCPRLLHIWEDKFKV